MRSLRAQRTRGHSPSWAPECPRLSHQYARTHATVKSPFYNPGRGICRCCRWLSCSDAMRDLPSGPFIFFPARITSGLGHQRASLNHLAPLLTFVFPFGRMVASAPSHLVMALSWSCRYESLLLSARAASHAHSSFQVNTGSSWRLAPSPSPVDLPVAATGLAWGQLGGLFVCSDDAVVSRWNVLSDDGHDSLLRRAEPSENIITEWSLAPCQRKRSLPVDDCSSQTRQRMGSMDSFLVVR
jgi:hypothetical protein